MCKDFCVYSTLRAKEFQYCKMPKCPFGVGFSFGNGFCCNIEKFGEVNEENYRDYIKRNSDFEEL